MMQESNQDLWPVPKYKLEAIVEALKNLRSYGDACPVIVYLEHDFRGVYNPEAFEMIDSVEKHFKEKEREQYQEEISKEVSRKINEIQRGNRLELSDGSVAAAIYATAKYMRSKADWGAFYRILVDYCNWPAAYKEFEARLQRLNLKLSQQLTFDYQSLTKGIKRDWPKTYREWQTCGLIDPVLNHRKRVATEFLNNLKEQKSQEISDMQ